MCGILGIISFRKKLDLIDGLYRLKRLEYRGYDSAGLVTKEGFIIKKVGSIDNLIDSLKGLTNKIKLNGSSINFKTNLVIMHTRWATHGEVNEINAHPHYDCKKNIFVVHNGTIENYLNLKRELEKNGHKFISKTDSEVFAHFFEDRIDKGYDIKDIVRELFDKFKGTYALLVYIKNINKLLAIKKGSPLVIGIDDKNDVIYLSSDIYAFIDQTNKVIVLDDYEWVEIDLK